MLTSAGSFYDQFVLPAIGRDPNAIAGVIGMDLGWKRRKDGKWQATKLPPNQPWRLHRHADRIIYKPGKLGPLVLPDRPGGTWLELAAGYGVEPVGKERFAAIVALASCYGLTPPSTSYARVTEYAFDSIEGPALRLLRYDLESGKKRFMWQRQDGPKWRAALDDLSPKLYREERIRRAVERREDVHLVEGCKVADAAVKLGLNATTAPNGTDLDERHLASFDGASRVLIWPDADRVGRDYALGAGRVLEDVAQSVLVVEFFAARSGGEDLADLVEERSPTQEQLEEAIHLIRRPFGEWAAEYVRNRPFHGLGPHLEKLTDLPGGRNAMTVLAKELRQRTDAVGERHPFLSWLQERSQGPIKSVETEILEAALSFAEAHPSDSFSTKELQQHMIGEAPERWGNYKEGRPISIAKLGTTLKRLGIPSESVWHNNASLKRRSIAAVLRVAHERGLDPQSSPCTYSSLRPCDLANTANPQDLATLNGSEPRSRQGSCDPCDHSESLGTTRGQEISRETDRPPLQLEAPDPLSARQLGDQLSPDLREEFEERAAIMQHSGEFEQQEAEKRAMATVLGNL